MKALNPRVIAQAISSILEAHDSENVGIRLIGSPRGYMVESTEEPAPEGWEVLAEDTVDGASTQEMIVMSAYYLVESAILGVKV
jgi:hypothetical protein